VHYGARFKHEKWGVDVVKITLGGFLQWGGGDLQKILQWSQIADRTGADGVTVVDHVVMGENISAYPYGAFPGGPDGPWPEPLILLAAIAAVTTRIRLLTGILISPLRPTALLAKQLATLDVLSNGRTEIGLGTGWQKEEYDACNVPWEGRFGRLEEQVAACKVLWRDAPASFHGKYDNFDATYCRPAPVQAGGIPIWFGLAPSESNIARLARVASGWMPMERDPEKLRAHIAEIRAAFKANGRDPAELKVRAGLMPVMRDGKPDLDASLAQIPAYADAGVTHVELHPARFLPTMDGLEGLLEKALKCR